MANPEPTPVAPSVSEPTQNTQQTQTQEPAFPAAAPAQQPSAPPPQDDFSVQFPQEPFYYQLPNGQPAGAIFADKQFQPGSLEYKLRKNDQYKNANQYVFDRANGAFVNDSQDRNLPTDLRYFNDIKNNLPAGENSPDDVAWYILNTDQKRASWDANYIFGKIGPVLKEKAAEAAKNNQYFDIVNLNRKDIVDLAAKSGVNPSVIKSLIDEDNQYSRTQVRTSIYDRLRPMVDSLDANVAYGEIAWNDPENQIFNKTGLARQQAWLAGQKWKATKGTHWLRGAVDGIGQMVESAGYGISGIAQGTVGTLVAAGSGGNILIQDGKTVISDEWMGDDKKREEAQQTLLTADRYMRQIAPDLIKASGSGNEGKFVATIEQHFGQYADPEMINAFKKLSVLRQQGAYRPGLAYEKLANLGEGVLSAAPAMIRFFSDSVDPGSFSFRMQASLKDPANQQQSTPLFALTEGVVAGAYEGWLKNTSTLYREMKGKELDRNIDQWEANWRAQAKKSEPIVAQMYQGIGMTEAARSARGMLQDTEMQAAGQLVDPIMLYMGASKLLGLGAKSAEIAGLTATADRWRSVAAEVNYEMEAQKALSPELTNHISNVKAALEKAYPGAKVTEEDAMSIALGNRKGVIGQSASAKAIRKQVGSAISQNEALADKVKGIKSEMETLPVEEANAAARPVGGMAAKAAGATTQAVGGFFEGIGTWLEEAMAEDPNKGNIYKRALGGVVRHLTGPTGGIVTAFHFASQGDLFTAALAGTGVGGAGHLMLKPDFLKMIGSNVAQIGRISKSLGDVGISGKRYGGSVFLQSATELEQRAAAMGDTTSNAELQLQKNQLMSDAAYIKTLWRAGYEDIVLNTARVVWDDGVVNGGTGAFIAHLADRDATGAGAGIGTAVSLGIKSANRLYQMTPAGTKIRGNTEVIQDLATIYKDNNLSDSNKARISEYLGDPKEDKSGYLNRANIVRDLWISHNGRVEFVNESEFAAATMLTVNPEAEAAMIIKEAAAFSNDPAKAADYARQRSEQLKSQRDGLNTITVLSNQLTDQTNKLNSRNNAISEGRVNIKKLQQAVDDARLSDTSVGNKVFERAKVELEKAESAQSQTETEAQLLSSEIDQIKSKRDAALRSSGVTTAFRPFESRLATDGSTYRKVANGYYVQDGPNGRKTFIDIHNIDNLGAVSEGWHALLNDQAVKTLLPDMVDMVWGDPGSGKRIMSDNLRSKLFDAYVADMPADMQARFKSELLMNQKRWIDGGRKDPTILKNETQELLTWYMATIDGSKRPGYRPGLSTPRGLEASASRSVGEAMDAAAGRLQASGVGANEAAPKSQVGSNELVRLMLGDRALTDVSLVNEFKSLFDPNYGKVTRAAADVVRSNLEASGMRFVDSGDGTLRGYFFNNKNEIVRNPVLNAFYDRVITMTGGRGSGRMRPVNLYDSAISLEDRVSFIKGKGLDWVLTPDGKNILHPQEVAKVSTVFSNEVNNALGGVSPDKTGMVRYTHPDDPSRVVITGVPTIDDIAAVVNNDKIHPSFKKNLVSIMQSLAQGKSPSVLTGEYTNIVTVNESAITEARLRIGKDIDGNTQTRNIIPLSIKIDWANVLDEKGKNVKIKGEDGQMINLRQQVVKVASFDKDAFMQSKERAFSEGLVRRDKEGSVIGNFKDPKGNEYTAEYLRSLFVDDAGFMNSWGQWMNHYYALGPIDPHSGIPTKVTEPSAEMLDPTNPERGAAMRDALRIIGGMDTADPKQAWVMNNRPTKFLKGLTRGTGHAFTDFRLDGFSELSAQGDSFNVTQQGVNYGQVAYSPNNWKQVDVPSAKGKDGKMIPGMNIKSQSVVGGNIVSEDMAVDNIKTHPTLPDVKIFTGTDNAGKPKFAFTVGDGKIIGVNGAKGIADAIQQVRVRISAMENNDWVQQALGQYKGQEAAEASNAAAKSLVTAGIEKDQAKEVKQQTKQIAADTKKNIKEINSRYKDDLNSVGELTAILEKFGVIDEDKITIAKAKEFINSVPEKFKSEYDFDSDTDYKWVAYRLHEDLRKSVRDAHDAIGQIKKIEPGDTIPVPKHPEAAQSWSRNFALTHDANGKLLTSVNPNALMDKNIANGIIENEEINLKSPESKKIIGNRGLTNAVVADLLMADTSRYQTAGSAVEEQRRKIEGFRELMKPESERRTVVEPKNAINPSKPSIQESAPAIERTPVQPPEPTTIGGPEDIAAYEASRKQADLEEAQRVKQDPAVIEEERQRLQGEHLRRTELAISGAQKILKARAETKAKLEKQVGVSDKEREASNKRWASEGEKVGKQLDKKSQAEYDQWVRDQNAQVADFHQGEKDAIAQIERERAAKASEARRLEQQAQQQQAQEQAETLRKAKEADRQSKKLNAIIMARNRALNEQVTSVLAGQELRGEQVQKMMADFLSSNEPVIAPGLLILDPNNLPINAYRTASTVTGSRNIPISVRTNPMFLTQLKGWPLNYPQQATAMSQSAYESLYASKAATNTVNRYNSGVLNNRMGLTAAADRWWIADGGSKIQVTLNNLVEAAGGGNQRLYRAYGINGSQIYIGKDVKAAVIAVSQNEEEQRNRYGTKLNEGKPVTPGEMIDRSYQATQAIGVEPQSQNNRIPIKKQQLNELTQKYLR